MATIQSAIELQDNFSQVLYGVINAVNLTISSMEEMSYAMNTDMHVDTSSLQYAREEIAKATVNIDNMVSEVQAVEEPVQRVQRGFSGWQKAIVVANQAVGLIQNTLGRVGITDMGGAFDRIDTMNRFQKVTTIMTGDVQMANAALAELKETTLGTAYGLDVVASSTQGFVTRGMEVGTAVNQVRIWSDAVSFYGKGTNEQLESVVDAIGKMYSKGKVEADQLDRLFDAGIGAAEIYASAVGRSVNNVKEDLSDGNISSAQFIQVVSEALDNSVSHGAAKDAGGTWATTFANMQASFTRGWVSVIESVDYALASRGLPSSMEMITMFGQKAERVLNSVGNAMGFVVGIATDVGGFLGDAGSLIVDNWSLIAPVIGGVGTALLLYIGYLAAVKTAEMIATGVKIAYCIASFAHAAATGGVVTATASATAAQYGLNAALLASPITWILIIIIAIIAAIYLVVAAINKVTGSSISATGVIVGALSVVGAAIYNMSVGALDLIFGMINRLVNPFIEVANFIGNVFQNPISSIIYGFQGMADGILATLENIASAMDYVFASNMSGTIAGWREKVKDMADTAVQAYAPNENYQRIMENLNLSSESLGLSRIEYGVAYDNGYAIGKGLEDKFNLSGIFDNSAVNKAKDFEKSLANAGLTSGIGNLEKNTDKIVKSLDITSENLKYIRDFAVERAVNRYTSTSVRVEMINNNSISGDQDIDGIVNKLSAKIEENMNSSAEGVH